MKSSMTRIIKIASVAALGFGLLVSPLKAGWDLVWSARTVSYFFAEFDVPSACTVQINPFVSGSGGSYSPGQSNTWYSSAYSYETASTTGSGYVSVSANGQTTYVLPPMTVTSINVPGYSTSWGPASYIYTDGNYGYVDAVVYATNGGSGFFKQERRSSQGGSFISSESGSSTAGHYWVEITGQVAGDGQATAQVSIQW